MKSFDTKEALRMAIANIEAIKVYDKNNYKPEFTAYQQGLRAKLRDLTTVKIVKKLIAIRTYTEIGKAGGYTKKEIDQSISRVNWKPFRKDNLPLCQGKCLQAVIKECKIPLSGISKMDIHNAIKGTQGFYALDVEYNNGQVQIYIADNGCTSFVVATDLTPHK